MRILTIIELMRLTRIELTDLFIRITNSLPDLLEGSIERQNALLNLSNIRWALPLAKRPRSLRSRCRRNLGESCARLQSCQTASGENLPFPTEETIFQPGAENKMKIPRHELKAESLNLVFDACCFRRNLLLIHCR
jgi:hypothetical protein